jgi:DNA-cytosine methyltransferase
MNVLSLFDGMSCGQIALERLGIKFDGINNKYFASEIKLDAIKVTQYNYPNTIQLGDVKKVNGKELPKIDLLIGGSPCQDLSIANKERLGLKGTKSSLFYEYLRLLKEVKPKYFLLENVEMPIEDLLIITNELGVQPININSSLVSAQMRNRYYWTNIPGDETNLFGESYISQPKDRNIKLQDILESGFTDRKKARAVLESESRPLKSQNKIWNRYITVGLINIVFKDNKTYLRVNEATKKGYVDISDGECVDLSYINSKTRRGRKMDDKCNCLTRTNEYYVFKDGDLRYLTQIELERLQTVPEGYTKILSRNKAASLLGDGWTVEVIRHIFKNLINDKELFKVND